MAKAQVGDLIRITNVPEDWSYPSGGIYEVTEFNGFGNPSFEIPGRDDGSFYAEEDQYEIFRKAGEEDETVGCDMCSGDPERADCPYCATEEKAQDAVNSPNHYTQGRFETIEIIEEITKGYEDGYVAYCVGNTLKYLARAPFKHGEPTEDLAKAAKYLAFANAYLTQTTE